MFIEVSHSRQHIFDRSRVYCCTTASNTMTGVSVNRGYSLPMPRHLGYSPPSVLPVLQSIRPSYHSLPETPSPTSSILPFLAHHTLPNLAYRRPTHLNFYQHRHHGRTDHLWPCPLSRGCRSNSARHYPRMAPSPARRRGHC